MKPFFQHISALFITLLVVLFLFWSVTKLFWEETVEPIAVKPECWVESYPVKKLLRQVSWRDKTFVDNVNVHNAWDISEGDMDFILTVEAESQFDENAVGDHWRWHWFCQWNTTWHSETINDSNFRDPVWQIQKCFEYYTEVFNNGTISNRLYWYNIRHLVKDRFKFETEWKLRRVCK